MELSTTPENGTLITLPEITSGYVASMIDKTDLKIFPKHSSTLNGADQQIYTGTPYLTWNDCEEGLLYSILYLPEGELEEILTRTANLYPHNRSQLKKVLISMYQPSATHLKVLLKQPESLLMSILRTNRIKISTERYGLFPSASKFNHSCDPNCTVTINGETITITPIKEISPNQECTISYWEGIGKIRDLNTRSAIIMRRGLFRCKCSLCQAHCRMCLSTSNLKECSRCKTTFYCSLKCQLKDWILSHHEECS